jgi:cytochrome c5
MRSGLAATIACALLLAACGREEAAPEPRAPAKASAELQIDAASGLKMAENWQLVRAACTTCHSAKQITQQRGTAEQWLSMIRWMQKKQNLWEFDQQTEEKIVAYLAENYPPSAAQRRAALSPDLMPQNPYSH